MPGGPSGTRGGLPIADDDDDSIFFDPGPTTGAESAAATHPIPRPPPAHRRAGGSGAGASAPSAGGFGLPAAASSAAEPRARVTGGSSAPGSGRSGASGARKESLPGAADRASMDGYQPSPEEIKSAAAAGGVVHQGRFYRDLGRGGESGADAMAKRVQVNTCISYAMFKSPAPTDPFGPPLTCPTAAAAFPQTKTGPGRPLGEGLEDPPAAAARPTGGAPALLSELWPTGRGVSPEPSTAGVTGVTGGLVRTVTRSDVSIRLTSAGGAAAAAGDAAAAAAAAAASQQLPADQQAAAAQQRFVATVAAALRAAAAGTAGAAPPPAFPPRQRQPVSEMAAAALAPKKQPAEEDIYRRVGFLLKWGFLLDDVVGDEIEVMLKFKADATAAAAAAVAAAAGGGDGLLQQQLEEEAAAAAEPTADKISAAARAVARCTPGAVSFYLLSALHRLAMAALFGSFHYNRTSESQVGFGHCDES